MHLGKALKLKKGHLDGCNPVQATYKIARRQLAS